ncbi:MAG: type II toxin-antitoxin system HicB family antitoxin [bacterium]
MMYSAVIHKDKGSDYGVSFPDLPGCFSAGETMQAALDAAREAVAAHIEGMLLDGEPMPSPDSIDTHQANPDYAGGVWALVAVDLGKISGKAKRINITLPERALSEFDLCAKAIGETRSGFLLRAALEFIARRRAA